VARMDAALANLTARGMDPRAFYLTPFDYAALAKAKTKRWREDSGSGALVWPLSHRDVPLIGESLIEQMIPVRQTTSSRKQSTLYSTRGVSVNVPRHLEIPA
jgi:hypothetical protein